MHVKRCTACSTTQINTMYFVDSVSKSRYCWRCKIEDGYKICDNTIYYGVRYNELINKRDTYKAWLFYNIIKLHN